MAERFRLQRVRSFHPLAGTGPFLSNHSDSSSSGNSRRPYTGGFQVSSAKTHERNGSHLSKRVSTAVDSNRRYCYWQTPKATTFETGQLEATGDQSTVKGPHRKKTNFAETGHDGSTMNENPVDAERKTARPKRMITVILPSLKMTDEEDDIVAMDTCDSHVSLADAERDSLMRDGSNSSTQRNRIDDHQSRSDQRPVPGSRSDRTEPDQSTGTKSADPVYKLRYVHFDKNRAAVGHARQITNRLYAINVGSETGRHLGWY